MIFVTGLAILLPACVHSQKDGRTRNASFEKKVEDGQVNVALNGQDDPVLAHMRARQQVDPRETNSTHRYTENAEQVQKEIRNERVRIAQWPLKSQENPLPAPEAGVVDVQVPQPEAAMPHQIAPAAGYTGMAALSNVTGVRVGIYPDKTRFVLDVSSPAEFSYNLDNEARILQVQLPDSSWTGPVQETLQQNPMIRAYSAAPGQNGMILKIELKKPAKMLMGSALPANDTYGHRIVFDVAPL